MMEMVEKTTAQPSLLVDIPKEFVHRSAWKAGVLGALNVLIQVVSARLIVMVAVVGGIALTSMALTTPDLFRLGALAIYAGAVVIPAVWLASR